MSELENSPRTVRVSAAGTIREVTVSPCPMGELDTCDQFVGPDGVTLYEVWTSCAEHEHGWLEVRNLSMTAAEATARLEKPGAVEPGSGPRDGFFAYTPDTLMDRVIHDF